jgi:hypothetical protein
LYAVDRRVLVHGRCSTNVCDSSANSKPLLDDVGQLMSKEPSSFGSVGSVLADAENDIVPESECPGMDCTRGIISTGTRMDTDLTKVVTELRLHEPTRAWIQRPAC